MLTKYIFALAFLVSLHSSAFSDIDMNIDVFKENINFTYNNKNTGLIEFLDRNNGKVVFIDNYLDTSLSVQENGIVSEDCDVDIDSIAEKRINGKLLVLPVYDYKDEEIVNLNCTRYQLQLNLKDKTFYEYSAGGTGVVMVRFRGFFEVVITNHSGPSVHFHLNEVDVPSDIKLRVLNKSS